MPYGYLRLGFIDRDRPGMIGRLFFRRPAPAAATPTERIAPVLREPARMTPGEAFTPTRPKPGRRQLVGRQLELDRILLALRDERAHVVLFSERGRGKTSLSNLVVESLRHEGTVVARHTCEAGSSFDSILHGLARDLPASLLATAVGAAGEGCEAALPPGELRPRDVLAFLPRLACNSLVCLVDEFDRVEDPGTRTRMADTIKQLSDRGTALSFLIIGVSENLEQILGQHPSIQRNLVAVPLPLLADAEIATLIEKGSAQSGFSFFPAAVGRITVLARGMPYMAQLLGLRLTQAASARGDTAVTDDDFDAAVNRIIEDAAPSVTTLYANLTVSCTDTEMVAALRRLATAPQDKWGRLQVLSTPKGAVIVSGRAITADCWGRLEAAKVIQFCGIGSNLATFTERALLHHVLLLAARDTSLPGDVDRRGATLVSETGSDAVKLHSLAAGR